MKLPFVQFDLYKKVIDTIENKDESVIPTTSRSTTIINKFIGKTFTIHNGKSTDNLTILPSMVGYKLGAFILTKKLGNSIHNSDHNRKVKEKARRKITQKKVRKTTTATKAKSTKKK